MTEQSQRGSWLVPVINKKTGEGRVFKIENVYERDAQYEALVRAFYEQGWRSATAWEPMPSLLEGTVA